MIKQQENSYNFMLRDIRESTRMSWYDFAKWLGVYAWKYKEIENVHRYPSMEEATLIADILDENVYELFPKWSVPVCHTTFAVVRDSSIYQFASSGMLTLVDSKHIHRERSVFRKKLYSVKRYRESEKKDLIEMGFWVGYSRKYTVTHYENIIGRHQDKILEDIERRTVCVNGKSRLLSEKEYEKYENAWVTRTWRDGRLVENRHDGKGYVPVKNSKGEEVVGKTANGKWVSNI